VYLEHDRLIHGLDPVAGAVPEPPLGDLLHLGDQFGCAIAAAQVGDRQLLGLRAESEFRVLRAKQLPPLLLLTIQIERPEHRPVAHHHPQASPGPLEPLLLLLLITSQSELRELDYQFVREAGDLRGVEEGALVLLKVVH
jgi:hypothetical protein